MAIEYRYERERKLITFIQIFCCLAILKIIISEGKRNAKILERKWMLKIREEIFHANFEGLIFY